MCQLSFKSSKSGIYSENYFYSTDAEKKISEEYSSLLNRAYYTLQLPLNRAIHMLTLNRINIIDEEADSDQDFLMEIMELNEEVNIVNNFLAQ